MKNKNFKIIKRFGPSVLKVRIPLSIVNKLNKYIDDVVKSKTKSNKLDYGENLVGDVSQEFRLEKKIMKITGWENFIKSSVKRWLEIETNKKLKKINIMNSWVVRQFKNEYNPVHIHGGDVSGVGYLKVPSKVGKTFQKDKTNDNGKLRRRK